MDVEAAPPGTLLEPGRLRPTRRMLVVPTLGLLLWAAGANAGAGYLVVLAGGLVASIPWAWWSARRASRGVRARRELPGRAIADEVVDLSLHVRVEALGAVVVRDDLTRAAGIVERAKAGEVLQARVALPRGIADAGVVTVEVTDPFGLFRSQVTGKVPANVEVWPPVEVVPLVALASAARRAADDRPRRRGQGTETDGTREYRHGDSPRAVHWRSSARRDDLVVREFVGDASGRVRVTIEPGEWTVDLLDRACIVAGSVAESAARGGATAELGVRGAAVAWTLEGRRLLASLTPNLGSPDGHGLPSIGLAGQDVVGDPDVELVLRVTGGECVVAFVRSGTSRVLGTLPDARSGRELVAWVADRLRDGGLT